MFTFLRALHFCIEAFWFGLDYTIEGFADDSTWHECGTIQAFLLANTQTARGHGHSGCLWHAGTSVGSMLIDVNWSIESIDELIVL